MFRNKKNKYLNLEKVFVDASDPSRFILVVNAKLCLLFSHVSDFPPGINFECF